MEPTVWKDCLTHASKDILSHLFEERDSFISIEKSEAFEEEKLACAVARFSSN